MKKILLILILFVFIVGCSEKQQDIPEVVEEPMLIEEIEKEEVDELKDTDEDGVPDYLDPNPSGGGIVFEKNWTFCLKKWEGETHSEGSGSSVEHAERVAQAYEDAGDLEKAAEIRATIYPGQCQISINIQTNINKDWYDYIQKKPREKLLIKDYITPEDPTIKEISRILKDQINKNEEINKEALISNFTILFLTETEIDDYPKFPTETLVEEKGDTEDQNILTKTILKAIN